MKNNAISISNYQERVATIKINSLPKVLQQGHAFFLEAKPFYESDAIIKETIDLYLSRLNTHHSKKQEITTSLVEIDFITRFLAMHNSILSRAKLQTYIVDLHTAISEKQITKTSALADEINKIQQKLITLYNDGLTNGLAKIVINKKWLSKLQSSVTPTLSGISETKHNKPAVSIEKQSTALFSAMNAPVQNKTSNTFRLEGGLGVLLGDIERFELAITIEGDQGGGKTRFTYQLADAFATLGHRIAFFSLEIGRQSDLINRMKTDYLKPKHLSQIFIADQLPEGYKTIEESAQNFDVIIIDSWNKTGLPSQDFDRLRKSNPNTIFIVIFQRTTQKTIRGGTAPLFDAGINIEVVKADDSFKNNYAITSKNRYDITGIKYNIFNKDIINTEDTISESF